MLEHDVAAVDDIAEGSMRKIEVAGRVLLLTRAGQVCHAIDNVCPHAGGPLDEGVLEGDVVLCPWHKAAFSVISGKHLEPPAVDDVERFPVRVENGRVLATINAEPHSFIAAPAAPGTDERCFVIIGAGAAGAAAAQTLRLNGFGGRIVLIGKENELPYDRTVLSKYTLAGTQGGEKSPLQDSNFYESHRIERLIGTVSKIDPASRLITWGGEKILAYDTALIATGGAPLHLNVAGDSLRGVFRLRTTADATAIAACAALAKSAVVAGAGFIAMEAAASLRQRGLQVTVVAPQKTPFERQLGAEIGAIFQKMLEREGVVFRLRDEIVGIDGQANVEHVRLRSGARLQTELVVAGLGISPETNLFPDRPHRKGGGVVVDSRLRVTDSLFAAGDIAAFPLRGNGDLVRVEHWRVAQQQGRIAALNMLGRDVAFESVPYFWTTFFNKRLDYVGHAETWDDVVLDGDLAQPEFLAFYLRAGKVAAIAGLGRDKQMAAALNLMTGQRDLSLATCQRALERKT